MTDLKPCPFCGSTDLELDKEVTDYRTFCFSGIFCHGCHVFVIAGPID